MIYVSSSCVRNKKIKDSVIDLAKNRIKNIELSGGTEYYNGFIDDLLELKDKYDLNYLCHNYFPPPKEHFVLNLASLNDEIYEKTFNHHLEAIDLSKKLGASKFGFHAGFFIDPKVRELGKKISKDNIVDKDKAIEKFCKGFEKLQELAGTLKLYIENNVFSITNFKTFDGINACMLTNFNEYTQLKEQINFNLLLDVAHLKVSSNSFSLDFEKEFKNMISTSDHLHISDNDALHDTNNILRKDSTLMKLLNQEDLKGKDFTLEIYDGMDAINKSHEVLSEVVL